MEGERYNGYCEVCTRIMEMKEQNQPGVCNDLTDNFFITCVKNMESIIRSDAAVVYWLETGCTHMDAELEVLKPCPAHTICGWVPNLFGKRIGVENGLQGMLPPMCPRDTNFGPRVPRTTAPGETTTGGMSGAK